VPIADASQYGVIQTAAGGRRIEAFREKPADPVGLADEPDHVYASMGNYVFTTRALVEAVATDAADESSSHDLGTNIIPMLVAAGDAEVYDFSVNRVPGVRERDRGYWRDVGTLDAYYEASMDLVSPEPQFDLYNEHWPILSLMEPLPPAKFITSSQGLPGMALDSIVSPGAVVRGGQARRSGLFPGVRVKEGADVESSVLMNDVDVAPGAVVRGAIVDKNVRIPEGARVGVDLDIDRERFVVSAGGIVVIGKGQKIL